MGAFIRRRTELYVALRRADLLMAASPERCAQGAPRIDSTKIDAYLPATLLLMTSPV